MKKIHFSTKIKAPASNVWDVLWNDATYRAWTKVFDAGSHAISDWNEGSKILFLASGGRGMYSTIARKIPNAFMSFKHLGELKNGVEQPIDEKTKHWSGAMENYTLSEKDGYTELSVDLDMNEDDMSYFEKIFPEALEKVKELSETRQAQA